MVKTIESINRQEKEINEKYKSAKSAYGDLNKVITQLHDIGTGMPKEANTLMHIYKTHLDGCDNDYGKLEALDLSYKGGRITPAIAKKRGYVLNEIHTHAAEMKKVGTMLDNRINYEIKQKIKELNEETTMLEKDEAENLKAVVEKLRKLGK
jgi:hypothetical protein